MVSNDEDPQLTKAGDLYHYPYDPYFDFKI